MDETKVCPYCSETIKGDAIVCRYCGRDLNPTASVKRGLTLERFVLLILGLLLLVAWIVQTLTPQP